MIKSVSYTRSNRYYNLKSLHIQEQAIQQYATDNNLEIAGKFSDLNTSGDEEIKPSLQRLLKVVRQDPTIENILVHSPDRLFRSLTQLYEVLNTFKTIGKKVIFVGERRNLDVSRMLPFIKMEIHLSKVKKNL